MERRLPYEKPTIDKAFTPRRTLAYDRNLKSIPGGKVDFSPGPFRYLENLITICVGTGHLRAKLIRLRGKFTATARADKFYFIGGKLDVFRSRNHEFLCAIGAFHDGMKQFPSRRKADRTVRTFESERHGEGIFHPNFAGDHWKS